MRIVDVRSRQILDSRGNPTVETDIVTKKGVSTASVPSGASTGIHEAVELRDHRQAFLGRGVTRAVGHVLRFKRALQRDWRDQAHFDNFLYETDGTEQKSRLGANALLSLSLAFSKAQALEKNLPLYQHLTSVFRTKKCVLPVPGFNVINGGKHAGTPLAIQEYLVLPTRATSFSKALQIGSEAYHVLRSRLEKRFGRQAVNVGDEGGFAPPMKLSTEPFDAITDALQECGHQRKVTLGMDAAASSFYSRGRYTLDGHALTTDRLFEKYIDLVKAYPIVSLEDPFHEDDFQAFAELTSALKGKVQVVGDDLLVTNAARVRRAIETQACTCLLLKVNQIGTLTEALSTARLALSNAWNVMVSHRSGETTDSFIADLAVGIGCGQIKAGAPCRGERVAKYNRLLHIEEELGKRAVYGGSIR